ncbi:MAG TPA: response regulator [Anaeromyxobacteraceae bacterium]|nr:response regulator [Anaeromyxobacteraceae bacterium]
MNTRKLRVRPLRGTARVRAARWIERDATLAHRRPIARPPHLPENRRGTGADAQETPSGVDGEANAGLSPVRPACPLVVEWKTSQRMGDPHVACGGQCRAPLTPQPPVPPTERSDSNPRLLPYICEDGLAPLWTDILAALSTPVFAKDERRRFVFFNDAFLQLVARRREELLNRSDSECLQTEVFRIEDDKVFATGLESETEGSFRDAAGRAHSLQVHKSLLRDHRGCPLLLGVVTDITLRKEMEDALLVSRSEIDHQLAMRIIEVERARHRLTPEAGAKQRAQSVLGETEQRFRRLADALPQIVWTSSPAGEIDYINARGSEYAGVPVETAFRNGWLDYVHEEDREGAWSAWSRSIRSGKPFDFEYRLRRRDGVYRWQLVRAVPLCNAEGDVLEWFGTATDIENEKLAKEAMREEDQRKNDFLALLSHELRNPLAPIRNASHILRSMNARHPDSERALSILDRQIELMSRLIDDLLDVSRIAHGKILLHRARIDLVPLLRALTDDRREGLEKKGLVFEAKIPDEPLWVDADAARFAQALGNLLENSQKYTEPGGAVVLEARAESGQAVVFVTDSGAGLSPAALERIFLPFVQLEAPASHHRVGLGLGLSLVRSIAELHGGSVEARSAGAGKGSTFTFRIPLASDSAVPVESTPAARAPLGCRKILVVEDNPDAAESLRLMLELDGHKVVVATSGEEGVARARSIRPDIVLSDVGLPGISGYELARILRSDPTVDSHLVAITGYGQAKDREEALRSGFEHHIVKPFDPDQLHQLFADFEH